MPLVSVRARTWGLITQHATSACRSGAVSLHAHPVHDPCSREGDAGIIGEVEGVGIKEEDFPDISCQVLPDTRHSGFRYAAPE